MDLAKVIASPPATFKEIINESLALAKGYTRERYAIMEPYWKVVSGFKGQGVAERQAKEAEAVVLT